MATKVLTETAAKWYKPYKNLSTIWAKFSSLLTQRFTSITQLNKLHIQLYSGKREEKESVGDFLQRKFLLALCLRSETTELENGTLLLESLKL